MSIQRVFLILLAAVLLPASVFAQTTDSRATFTVNKTFTDSNNTLPIRYDISCNTGVPIAQHQDAPAGSFAVEFVVESFDQGQLDCRVWETEAAGYSAVYSASSAISAATNVNTGSTPGCFFDNVDTSGVGSGVMNVCDITNSPDPVTISVTKDWVIDNLDSGAALDSAFSLKLSCVNVQGNQTQSSSGGTTDKTFTFAVTPAWNGGTNCSVDESVFDSAIEVDNGCQLLHVAINQGASCTVTNTVFFEGIPTLNQYGLAILALLMLGVGFVGFRRLV